MRSNTLKIASWSQSGVGPAGSAAAQDKPNILVIWGDDIGMENISHNTRGMMGYRRPTLTVSPKKA